MIYFAVEQHRRSHTLAKAVSKLPLAVSVLHFVFDAPPLVAVAAARGLQVGALLVIGWSRDGWLLWWPVGDCGKARYWSLTGHVMAGCYGGR